MVHVKMFDKILIANRGEIAVRIIKSARELGVRTVAVYSEADRESLHVEAADEAICIGESDLGETYLNGDKIISAARESGCRAIHPGYGFLAENPEFVKRCEDENLVFIGASSDAIRLMGDKLKARASVKEMGVPTTPGSSGEPERVLEECRVLPYPLLVKAALGGGGKGMRIVRSEEELKDALSATSREAKAYFGDGTVYVEQYIDQPRHIEIQILGDGFGNMIHLFERECTIQRRYQKIIEETPSSSIDDETRMKMGQAAVTIGQTIGYHNAGTVEFLVDQDKNFYFLEMNTRIQVEHPVTEMTTGVDIVKQQLLVASGNELAIKQEDVGQRGHAIECRIYAEDPLNNFAPSPGWMTFFQEPRGLWVRNDSSFNRPCEIKSFFDPIISKLIVWEESRETARLKMIQALREYVVQGIHTNIPFLRTVLQHEAFIDNRISTHFCDDYMEELIESLHQERDGVADHVPLIAYLLYDLNRPVQRTGSTGDSFDHDVWRLIGHWRV